MVHLLLFVTSEVPPEKTRRQMPWDRNEAAVGSGAASAKCWPWQPLSPRSVVLALNVRAGPERPLCLTAPFSPPGGVTRSEGPGLKLRREGRETWLQLLRTESLA